MFEYKVIPLNTKHRNMKKVTVYGVKLTSIQEMMFMKYINNNSIAPNTMDADQRKQLVIDWLNKN